MGSLGSVLALKNVGRCCLLNDYRWTGPGLTDVEVCFPLGRGVVPPSLGPASSPVGVRGCRVVKRTRGGHRAEGREVSFLQSFPVQ